MELIIENNRFEIKFESEEEKICKKYYSLSYNDFRSPTGFSYKSIVQRWENREYLPIGYLKKFLSKCKKHNINIKTIEKKTVPSCSERFFISEDREQRKWQTECLEVISKVNNGMISSPTGAGKSFVIEEIVAQKRGVTLIICHNTDLQREISENLKELLGNKYVTTDVPERPDWLIKKMEAEGEIEIPRKGITAYEKFKLQKKRSEQRQVLNKEWHKPITVICWNSLKKLPQWYLDLIQTTVIDECDYASIDDIRYTVMRMPQCYYLYGLSATPWRDQSYLHTILNSVFENGIIYEYTTTEAIEDKVICKPDLLVYKSNAPDKFIKYMKDWRGIVNTGFIENQNFNKQIAKYASEYASNMHKVMILVDETKHGEAIQLELNKINEANSLISGQLTKKEYFAKKEELKSTDNSESYIAIGTPKVGRGVNIPNISKLIVAVNGKASNKAIQRFGRALRVMDGKASRVEIIIFYNWWNDVTAKHSRAIIKIFEDYYKIKATR